MTVQVVDRKNLSRAWTAVRFGPILSPDEARSWINTVGLPNKPRRRRATSCSPSGNKSACCACGSTAYEQQIAELRQQLATLDDLRAEIAELRER